MQIISLRLTLPLLVTAAAACSPDPLTAPPDPVAAKGGEPRGGGTTGIVPVKLGNPKEIGCSSTRVEGVSAGLDPAAPTLAVGFGFCAGTNTPVIWSSKDGLLPTGGSPGQIARAASDNGVIVGIGPDGTPVVFDLSGNVAVDLPMPSGHTWGTASGITPDGRFAVGYGGVGNSSYALRWTRSTTTGAWSVEQVGTGWPVGRVSAAGDLIVGTRGLRAVAWRLAGASWAAVELPTGGAERTEAYDVNGAGSVIVGLRELPLTSDPAVRYEEPVAWIANGGGWDLVSLEGTDPNIPEGAALGVADRTSDGSTLVAGVAWVNTSGPGGTPWAVVWRRASGATAFDPPVRLQPLSKTFGATARAVNTRGEVVGDAGTGRGSQSVMWKLPPLF